MQSFGQYEIKSSESTRYRGSILMRFRLLEPPQLHIHCFLICFQVCWEIKILGQVEIVVILISIFHAQSMFCFVQYEIKSSEATPFCRSILMQFESLEPTQFSLHASQFALKSVANWKILRQVEIFVIFTPISFAQS